jgi:hypothetical protein
MDRWRRANKPNLKQTRSSIEGRAAVIKKAAVFKCDYSKLLQLNNS